MLQFFLGGGSRINVCLQEEKKKWCWKKKYILQNEEEKLKGSVRYVQDKDNPKKKYKKIADYIYI